MSEIYISPITRWWIYIGIVLISNYIKNDIVSKFQFPVRKKMTCFAFGNTKRCVAVCFFCQVTRIAAIFCWFVNFLSIFMEGDEMDKIIAIEIKGCLSQIMMWVLLFIRIIGWAEKTEALYYGDWELLKLFLCILIIIWLFCKAVTISYTQLAHLKIQKKKKE